MARVDQFTCDSCGKLAALKLEVQGVLRDLCSRKCAHDILEADLDRQQRQEPRADNRIRVVK